MTTKNEIKEIVQKEYAREAGIIALQAKVRAALVPFDGKQVSKRLATAAQKALGDNWRVDLDRPSSTLAYLRCVPYDANDKFKPYKWDDRVSFQLPDDIFRLENKPTGVMTGSGFDTLNAGLGGECAKERQRRREALLSDGKKLESLAILIDSHKKITAALEETLDEWEDNGRVIPDNYAIGKLYEGDK